MGRPRIDEDKKKKYLTIRANDGEKKLIKKAADAAGKSQGQFVIDSAKDYLKMKGI